MTYKVDYEFKKDKLKRKYALKVNLITGKKERINYKIAQRRVSNLKYSRKKAVIVQKLKDTGSGATYKDYQKISPVIEQEIRKKRIKQKQPPLSQAVMRGRVKAKAIEHRTGIATRYRYAWVYRLVVGRFYDEDTKETLVECDTPIFEADALLRNGNEFQNMVELCQEAYDEIMALDLCSLDGGGCVLLYNKSDKSVIKKFELGKGCGFSFDFENYEHDDNILDNKHEEI